VAHELRTPLATLIGETEVALSRERSAESLRDTLASNLEEMQRLSAMVNDMLFLSNADRGAVARRGAPVSLATLARQVAEFHEGTLDEAGLTLDVVGDATVAVDEPLVKRALSNLLGNATRFAARGSTVQVRIAGDTTPRDASEVEVVVQNQRSKHRASAAAPSVRPLLPRRRVALLRRPGTAPRAGAGDRGCHRPHARRANAGPVARRHHRGRIHRRGLNGAACRAQRGT
jgi:hypothetical protein